MKTKTEEILDEGMEDFGESMLASVFMKTNNKKERSAILILNIENSMKKAIQLTAQKIFEDIEGSGEHSCGLMDELCDRIEREDIKELKKKWQ